MKEETLKIIKHKSLNHIRLFNPVINSKTSEIHNYSKKVNDQLQHPKLLFNFGHNYNTLLEISCEFDPLNETESYKLNATILNEDEHDLQFGGVIRFQNAEIKRIKYFRDSKHKSRIEYDDINFEPIISVEFYNDQKLLVHAHGSGEQCEPVITISLFNSTDDKLISKEISKFRLLREVGINSLYDSI